MTAEKETIAALRANLDAALRALDTGDMAALAALAEQEARYMDTLRAIWAEAS